MRLMITQDELAWRVRLRKLRQKTWLFYVKEVVQLLIITIVAIVIMSNNIDFLLKIRWYVWEVPRSLQYREMTLPRLADMINEESTILADASEAARLYRSVRIICIIPTVQSHVDSGQVKLINSTWGKRCNKVIYVLCPTTDHPSFLDTCMYNESKAFLLNKVTHALFHIYKNYRHEFDWVLKADDDTYVIMENLRFLLSHHNSQLPVYLGHHFRTHIRQGYHSGGAGFVISKTGLQQVMERGYDRGLCSTDGEIEDLEIGRCLEIAKVPVLSSLDKYGRHTFHVEDYVKHMTYSAPEWLYVYSRENGFEGANCCSQFVVSFHHMDMYSLVFLHQMLYRTSVYGVHTLNVTAQTFPVKKVPPLKNPIVMALN